MKKVIITAYNLEMGGIETSLINMLNNIDYKNYEITLLLEEVTGPLFKKIPPQVKIIEYRLSNSANIIFRKIYNRFKLIKTIIKHYNKYDASLCYAPYSIPSSILVRYFSKNNSIFIHSNYYYLYDKNLSKIKWFFNARKVSKFKRVIFVSEEAKKNFVKVYPNLKSRTHIIHNQINFKNINVFAKEKIFIDHTKYTFLNVARHEEHSKKLTRLISAVKILRDKNLSFLVYMLGDGPDHKMYQDLIDKYDLSSHIKLMGQVNNPYPYFKNANCFILTSDYEGFPVVYLEALAFKNSLITTIDVNTPYLKIKDYNAVVIDKDIDDIVIQMELAIKGKIKPLKSFDDTLYNKSAIEKINKLFNNEL